MTASLKKSVSCKFRLCSGKKLRDRIKRLSSSLKSKGFGVFGIERVATRTTDHPRFVTDKALSSFKVYPSPAFLKRGCCPIGEVFLDGKVAIYSMFMEYMDKEIIRSYTDGWIYMKYVGVTSSKVARVFSSIMRCSRCPSLVQLALNEYDRLEKGLSSSLSLMGPCRVRLTRKNTQIQGVVHGK